ncbi:MAG: NAD-dependent epimerase/dehydratase family protein [Deltaproteobacteria bacterium]|nr:NAD-dependent epimerase/dehydratase family protein [Deltaproteobacteria bacterium]
MKLAILGASGGIGRHLVTQALAAGHDVTAVARASSRLEAPPALSLVRGELDDVAVLTAAFRGGDAVLSSLGLKLPGLAPWMQAEDPGFLDRSSPAIVAAMQAAGVRRLLFVSSSGVGDSAALLPGFFKAFIAVTAMRTVFPALQRMEDIFFASGLDVCAVRPTGLSDGPAAGKVVVPKRLVGQAQIARADVAAWMLQTVAQAAVPKSTVLTTTGAG